MRVVCVGGGPAGLYFAVLWKKVAPSHEVVVYERNRPDDTFGWGVVLSDSTLGSLAAADPESYEEIQRNFYHWDDIEIHFRGTTIRSGGHGFAGIARTTLLRILQDRARGLGAQLVFQHEVEDPEALAAELDADLVVAADGVNSRTRARYAEAFQPHVELGRCRYVWLGTRKHFQAFTFAFEETPWGWFTAHAYPFDGGTSTFIVETPEDVWRAAGLHEMDKEESIAFCERLFARYLDGHRLLSNAAHLRGSAQWLRFPWLRCQRWVHRIRVEDRWVPVVLVGDAAHTVHFSVGSGTRLAMEDAIGLVKALATHGHRGEDLSRALEAYERDRQVELQRLRHAGRNSADWFENVRRYAHLEPEQFAYTLLTRSQRLFHEELRQRDPAYVARFEAWFARRCGLDRAVPPMFTPFQLRSVRLKNRVVVSPMAMYSAEDGTVGDFHLVHLGARALGGAALVFTEMTCVSREGRISPGCAGLYKPEHVEAWRRIVRFVHEHTDAKIALQLGHSGPKGSTRVGWEGYHEPLPEGNWPVLGPSPVPWGPRNQVPRPMTREDMERVREEFVRATRWAVECGFDWLEVHCAHGYLLSAFISPLTNLRRDEYGGSLENRMRFPLEVVRAVRAAWPDHLPLSVRISAFGQEGPYRDRPGFGAVAEAMGGLRFLVGYPDRPPPRFGVSIGDTLAGMFGALGALLALREREVRGGRGQVVDVAITDAVLAVLESVLAECSVTGAVRERSGTILPGVAPSNLYETRDGRWVVVAANADGVFRRLCDAMGRPEWKTDPRYASHEARAAHQGELDAAIAGWVRQLSAEELLEVLDRHGVPGGPVYTARDVLEDPHFRARGSLVEVENPGVGRVTMQAPVPRLGSTPLPPPGPAPELGQHTDQVLREVAGLSAEDIRRLREAGVV